MKKNELAKKSRKLFSAILAGAMLTTSAIPESFVWAAEDVQGFGDGEDNEDVIFESVEEFVAEVPWKKALRMELLFLAAAVRWQWEQRLRIRFRRGRER